MRTVVRILSPLIDSIATDLARPHPFAAERVGFLFGPSRRCGRYSILLPTDYEPVPDGDYVPDALVGARISRDPIRCAMQRVLRSGEGCLHIHAHGHAGVPWFSRVDIETTREIARSFSVVSPGAPHGALVLSNDSASVVTWDPARRVLVGGRVTYVGLPMSVVPSSPYAATGGGLHVARAR